MSVSLYITHYSEEKMNYLVHAHDSTAVLAANHLETLGGRRLIAGVPSSAEKQDMVALLSSDCSFLKGRFLRRLREDNQDVIGEKIPEWAQGAKEVILINPLRTCESAREQLHDTLAQLHARLTGIPLSRTSKNRRKRSRTRGDNRRSYYANW